MVKALFDTNILIDFLNGIEAADQEIKRHPDKAISLITWMEVMAGARGHEEELSLKRFLNDFKMLPIGNEVAAAAVKVRQARKLKLPDAIILATAQSSDRVLISRNTKDFPPDGEGVHVPYQITPPNPLAIEGNSTESAKEGHPSSLD
ncbi:MAG: type II toxin-antitoxin system VapC family toxin [Burkholderiaceae bacterium]